MDRKSNKINDSEGLFGYAVGRPFSGFKLRGGLPENHQSNPPLPRNRKPGHVPGFFVPAIHSFDVRFALDSGR